MRLKSLHLEKNALELFLHQLFYSLNVGGMEDTKRQSSLLNNFDITECNSRIPTIPFGYIVGTMCFITCISELGLGAYNMSLKIKYLYFIKILGKGFKKRF